MPQSYSFGIYDPVNPAQGVYLQYEGGNACKDSISEKAACTDTIDGETYCRRSLRLNFLCNDNVHAIPTVERVLEARGCAYEVTFNSAYGCPSECPVSRLSGRVCSGRGLCFYDGFEDGLTADGRRGRAQCLCEKPYGEKDCSGFATGYNSYTGKLTPVDWPFLVGMLLVLFGCGLFFGANARDRMAACLSGIWNLACGRGADDAEGADSILNDPLGAYSKVSAGYYHHRGAGDRQVFQQQQRNQPKVSNQQHQRYGSAGPLTVAPAVAIPTATPASAFMDSYSFRATGTRERGHVDEATVPLVGMGGDDSSSDEDDIGTTFTL